MLSRVLITRPMPKAVEAAARNRFDVVLRAQTSPMEPVEMQAALGAFDGIMPTLGDGFTADIIASAPTMRTRVLANFGVGYNHIDVPAARAAGLVVTNTPGAVTDATADLAMTLMLMSARRAGEGERLVRAGRWTGWHPTQMLGLHVTGKTAGIVGMGRIGQAIARRCRLGFGMPVLFFNRSVKTVEGAEQVATLAELAGRADVLIVAVPGGADTHHLIGADILAAMQPHAHLINIARGDVVDEAALIAALDRGGIAGAGLDVYEFEPDVPAALRAQDRAVLLPHLGTAAEEVRVSMGLMALDNLQAVLAGRAPPNPVP